MESLKTPDTFTEYDVEEIKQKLPGIELEGKPFEIEKDIERELVYLKIDGLDYVLTRRQALELSYALSREAKRIVKKQRKMLGRPR